MKSPVSRIHTSLVMTKEGLQWLVITFLLKNTGLSTIETYVVLIYSENYKVL
jgi:hypothetical protein